MQAAVPVIAVAGGTVMGLEESNPNGNGGQSWYVTLNHGNGYLTRYLHFAGHTARKNGTLLHIGDWVNQGDQD
jgi:murein DD-endopeptidase MepM/ murein hydrolase activator NlpD